MVGFVIEISAIVVGSVVAALLIEEHLKQSSQIQHSKRAWYPFPTINLFNSTRQIQSTSIFWARKANLE